MHSGHRGGSPARLGGGDGLLAGGTAWRVLHRRQAAGLGVDAAGPEPGTKVEPAEGGQYVCVGQEVDKVAVTEGTEGHRLKVWGEKLEEDRETRGGNGGERVERAVGAVTERVDGAVKLGDEAGAELRAQR